MPNELIGCGITLVIVGGALFLMGAGVAWLLT